MSTKAELAPEPTPAALARPERGFTAVRVVFGLLLLTAAGLKGYEYFAHAPPPGLSFWEARWFQLFLFELEACLGLWLVIGLLPIVSRRLAIMAFSMFAAVNVWQVWRGEPSCGCFGAVDFNPLTVLAFDIVCLGALTVCKPPSPIALAGVVPRSGRKRRVEFVVAACGLALLGGGLAAHAWYQPPAGMFRLIDVDPPIKDFGPVRQNEFLAHDFSFRNNWTDSIEVVKVLSSCSCTTADGFVGTVLAPGQSAPLHVTFRSGQHEGPQSGVITLFFQGPNSTVPAWKSVAVQANVGTDYRVAPTLIDFGTVNSDERLSRRIRLRPNLQRAVQVTGLESDNPGFRIQQVPAPPGNSDMHFDIEPRLQNIQHSGPVSTFVHIRTDSVRAPVTDIVVRAMIVATVEVEPECIVVGADMTGSVRSEVVLRTRSPARITGVRAPDLPCEFDTGTAVVHRVATTVPDGTAATLAPIEIDIELNPGTGAREARTVTIPIHRLPRQKKG